MTEDVLGLPPKVGADATGHMRGSLGTTTSVQAWGDNASEFREHPEAHVQPNQMGLPKTDYAGAVLEWGQGAWVLGVHVHA